MTIRRDPRILTDDDPTGEEEALDFDPTRTDQVDPPGSPSHRCTGIIERDERGHAVWRVSMPTDTDRTFDELRTLHNEKLAIDEPATHEPVATPTDGYNPYDTGPAKPPKRRRA